MDKRILTWDKVGRRWKRIYRGRTFYGKRGVRKSDQEAYRQAVNAWNEWKATADTDIEAHKPHAEQYRPAIKLRQAMLGWLDNEQQYASEYDQYAESRGIEGESFAALRDRLNREIERLRRDFARAKPPQLDGTGLPIDPTSTMAAAQRAWWRDNITTLETHDRWIGVTDHAKTIGANLDDFLTVKRQQADSGEIAYGWFAVIRYHLEHFRRYAGGMAVEQVNANLLSGYRARLLDTIKAGEITNTYGKGLLATVKQFVEWLWESEAIEHLPRNLRTLRITADTPTIKTLTTDEIKTLLTEATERTRLLVLLMLNTGMTGKDISDLTPDEVEWTTGRVRRRRSKTKRQKTVPVVDYKLWRTTFDLLRRYGSRKGERVFVNRNGEHLRRWNEKEGGKPRNVDNVRGVWAKLAERTGIRKPLKLLRTTSASTLAKHTDYGRFSFLFLGHSPKTTAERHYVQVPQDLFDKAVLWLGSQFGVE